MIFVLKIRIETKMKRKRTNEQISGNSVFIIH